MKDAVISFQRYIKKTEKKLRMEYVCYKKASEAYKNYLFQKRIWIYHSKENQKFVPRL